MAKVLYIKANPKPVEQSFTFKMSEALVVKNLQGLCDVQTNIAWE